MLFFVVQYGSLAQSHQLKTRLGEKDASKLQFEGISDIALDQNGNLYVVESTKNQVQKLSSAFEPIAKWGSVGNAQGLFNQPSGIALDKEGNVYIADLQNHRIQKFSASGEYLAQFGQLGSNDSELNSPAGIVIDKTTGDILVAERKGNRISRFDRNGNFKSKWGEFLRQPTDISQKNDGTFLVTEADNAKIHHFSNKGILLDTWPTKCSWPKAIFSDPAGYVYMADSIAKSILKFEQNGNFIERWYTGDSSSGILSRPVSLTVDSKGMVYVADEENNTIQVFCVTPKELKISGPGIAIVPDETVDPNDTILYNPVTYVFSVANTLGSSYRWNLPIGFVLKSDSTSSSIYVKVNYSKFVNGYLRVTETTANGCTGKQASRYFVGNLDPVQPPTPSPNPPNTIEQDILVYELITPNNDGKNDFLEIKNLDQYPENEIVLIDVKGNVVYKAVNYQNNWTAETLANGQYLYIVKTKKRNLMVKGGLTVMR